MFFLITHLIMEKYYPDIMSQFLVGSICYIFSYFILKDTIINIDQYKYYFLFVVVIDSLYLWKQQKNESPSLNMEEPPKLVSEEKELTPTEENINSSIQLATDSSDIFLREISSLPDNSTNGQSSISNHSE